LTCCLTWFGAEPLELLRYESRQGLTANNFVYNAVDAANNLSYRKQFVYRKRFCTVAVAPFPGKRCVRRIIFGCPAILFQIILVGCISWWD